MAAQELLSIPDYELAARARLEPGALAYLDGGAGHGQRTAAAGHAYEALVMMGRPVAWGLAVGGAQGARKALEILLSELDTALALAGAPRAAELDSSFLAAAPR